MLPLCDYGILWLEESLYEFIRDGTNEMCQFHEYSVASFLRLRKQCADFCMRNTVDHDTARGNMDCNRPSMGECGVDEKPAWHPIAIEPCATVAWPEPAGKVIRL